jgi:CRP/FNR family cyclic AMP-dependent transcriptional regulator
MRLREHDLRQLPLFSETSRSELALVSRLVTRVTIPAGRVFVHEGARGSEFMIIFDGVAKVSKAGTPVATIGRGDIVGEMALLDESGFGRRNATVTAVTDLVIYVGTPAEFRQMIDAAPSVAAKVHRTAASRVLVAA